MSNKNAPLQGINVLDFTLRDDLLTDDRTKTGMVSTETNR